MTSVDDLCEKLVAVIDERIALKLAEAESVRPAPSSSPWLTVAEAAGHLRTTRGAIYKRIKRGQLTAHRPNGSQILLHRDDLV